MARVPRKTICGHFSQKRQKAQPFSWVHQSTSDPSRGIQSPFWNGSCSHTSSTTRHHSSLFKGRLPTGFIYTMGANESRAESVGYPQSFRLMEGILRRTFGSSEYLVVTDTYQFDDYTRYETSGFDVEGKRKRKQEVFPQDCRLAFEMGARLARAKWQQMS